MLRQGAFTMGNLEGPICNGGEADAVKLLTGGGIIRMPPEAAHAMKRAGITAVSLANNHCMDLGPEKMIETIELLDAAGVAWSGDGRNLAEARKPAIMERNGVRRAFLSYTSTFMPGTHPADENKIGMATVAVTTAYELPANVRYAPGVQPRVITTADRKDVERMIDDVKRARTQADVVVVSWHWGLTRYANSYAMGIPVDDAPFFVHGYQEEMGRAAIDAGADLVMGHHPHRLQGMEIYKGKLICYSLCDLVMSFDEVPNFGPESAIVKGYIDAAKKQVTRYTFIPMLVPHGIREPFAVPGEQAGEFVTLLTGLSKKYRTKFRLEGDEIAIEAP